MSRPAVSQHLRVLETAGLVTHRREGTRNLDASTRAASPSSARDAAEKRESYEQGWGKVLAVYERRVETV